MAAEKPIADYDPPEDTAMHCVHCGFCAYDCTCREGCADNGGWDADDFPPPVPAFRYLKDGKPVF